MNILRRLGLSLSVLLFSFGISITALFISLYSVIHTPERLEQALSSSGIYSVFAQNIVSQTGNDSSTASTSDPGIRRAFEQALPPTFLQNSSEQVINGVYDWVQGRTATLVFSIDLTQVKTNFADNIASYVRQKLDNLPACTYMPIALPPTTIDQVLSLTCMPRGVSSATIAASARQEVLTGKLFSDANVINASTLKDKQGGSFTDKLAFVPQVYHYYELSLVVLPILTLLTTVAIIFWSATKRTGIKRIAWLLISVGLTTLVLAIVEVTLLHVGVTFFSKPLSSSSDIQEKFLLVLESLAVDLRVWWFGFGLGYTILGIVLLIVVRFNRPRPALVMGSERGVKSESDAYAPVVPAEPRKKPDMR